MPTVGAHQMLEGNGVSLTRLLRNSKLSLIEFFDKVKKWADMTNLKQDMVEKIEKLQRNFSTSYVIFKKYQPIFSDIFKVKISRYISDFRFDNSQLIDICILYRINKSFIIE